MNSSTDKAAELLAAVQAVADEGDADVLLICGDLMHGLDDKVCDLVHGRQRRKNVKLFMCTPGGIASEAYRIARCLQHAYEKFSIVISGYCKSAGTLCVLGANEVVMTEHAELGPLDVQIAKKDELGERNSGLVMQEAFNALQEKSFELFQGFLLEIKARSDGLITFKTATDIASRMSVGLFEPIYKQIDPIQLGENVRSMTVAEQYGKRLIIKGGNCPEEHLKLLIENYPDHGFVIDKREATELFKSVREPSAAEYRLIKLLGPILRYPEGDGTAHFLSQEASEIEGSEDDHDASHPIDAGASRPGGGETAAEEDPGRADEAEGLAAVAKASEDNLKLVRD